jgi:hypothetical protein
MGVQHLPAHASAQDIESVLREDGAAIVDRVAPTDLMDRNRVGAASVPRRNACRHRTRSPASNTRRTGSLIARSPSFRELAAHPLVTGALDLVLGDHATSYQLHLTQIIDIGPGEPGQMVHRDQWAFDFFSFPKGFEVECHTIVGDVGVHRGERRDSHHPWKQPLGRTSCARGTTRPRRRR